MGSVEREAEAWNEHIRELAANRRAKAERDRAVELLRQWERCGVFVRHVNGESFRSPWAETQAFLASLDAEGEK